MAEGNSKKELVDVYFSYSPDQRKRLFASTAATSNVYGISQRTLQRWIEEGVIVAIRIGEKYQIYLPAMERYIAECSDDSLPEDIARQIRHSRHLRLLRH
jgi:excisionase family DNA binding protein